MIVYSFYVSEEVEGVGTSYVPASMLVVPGSVCCGSNVAATGNLVAVDIDVSDLASLLADADHAGCDAVDIPAFNTWLIARGLSQAAADSITNASDVAVAMASHIESQSV